MKKIVKLLIISVMLILSFGCVSSTASAASTSVKAMKKGATYTIKNTSKVTSSKKKVATAKKKSSSNYTITAKKAGTSTLKVYDKNGKLKKKIYLLVYSSSTLKYNTKDLNLTIGSSKKVAATIPKGCSVKYSSSKKKVASVNSSGKITAKKPGATTITAKVYYKGACIKTYKKNVTVSYSYEVYLVGVKEMYTDCEYCMYIKTDNPDPYSYDLVSSKGTMACNLYSSRYYSGSPWGDVKLEKNKNDQVYGGVINEYYAPDNVTTDKFYLDETDEDGSSRTIKTFNVELKDYQAGKEAFIEKLIKEHTTSSMTPFEKMDSICSYLKSSKSGFTYLKNVRVDGDDILLNLTTDSGPYFVTKQWDSYITPNFLVSLAETIGGFDYIHSCYWDYDYGTTKWANTHYICKVGIGDDIREYEVCPVTSTGRISADSIQYIDFKSTKNMTKLG